MLREQRYEVFYELTKDNSKSKKNIKLKSELENLRSKFSDNKDILKKKISVNTYVEEDSLTTKYIKEIDGVIQKIENGSITKSDTSTLYHKFKEYKTNMYNLYMLDDSKRVKANENAEHLLNHYLSCFDKETDEYENEKNELKNRVTNILNKKSDLMIRTTCSNIIGQINYVYKERIKIQKKEIQSVINAIKKIS